MNKVYVVLYNEKISSEGYNTIDKAVNFIEQRFGEPIQDISKGWLWIDKDGNEYKIKEINIR